MTICQASDHGETGVGCLTRNRDAIADYLDAVRAGDRADAVAEAPASS
ncbi:hypothetical protein GCM10010404_73220 [Nonomuraea africana]|uniref:Uncharacterized protein n=1 Tax=Nonomuraea africana TaxID=46171 RepID=A0ABR9K870_9ACTN|nr:hypothetical protein [Nonomuraea africana]MBE1557953.1 hypothetical protein [Nonomuraea africana]